MDLFPENSQIGLDKLTNFCYNTIMKNNDTTNERGNEMTFEFDNFDTEIQSDELVDERISDEDLASAAEFFDELEFELDELDGYLLDEETRLADEDWNAHHEAMDMDLLDVNGDVHDQDNF